MDELEALFQDLTDAHDNLSAYHDVYDKMWHIQISPNIDGECEEWTVKIPDHIPAETVRQIILDNMQMKDAS